MKEFLILFSSKPIKYLVFTVCAIVIFREFRKVMGCLGKEKSLADGATKFMSNSERSPLLTKMFNKTFN